MIINGSKLVADLTQLHVTWMVQSRDPRNEKQEWIRGVIYGIGLAMRTVAYYVLPQGSRP